MTAPPSWLQPKAAEDSTEQPKSASAASAASVVAAADDPEGLVHSLVEITGLSKAPAMNGQQAVVQKLRTNGEAARDSLPAAHSRNAAASVAAVAHR